MSPAADDGPNLAHADREDDLLGRVFDGRYEVIELIATGGMARVYRALDHRLDRDVALKVLRAHLGEDADFVRRFKREARVAARLQHPHIVSVFDQGDDHGHLFIAMEYVPGRTLRQVLQAEGALTPRAALDLMDPVLQALGHAHALGDLHRDVKPENVLIREDGVVKVTDFGLTRAVTSQTVTSASGILLGTVAYVSPEQVGRGVADERTDVYAAGLVLFELLTGEKAFGGDVPLNVAFQHVHEGAPTLASVVVGVPRALDELVAHATAMDPDERPTDAQDLRDQLRATRAALSGPDLDRHLVLGSPSGPPTDDAGPGWVAPAMAAARSGTPTHRPVANPGVAEAAATAAYDVDRGQPTALIPVDHPPAPAPPRPHRRRRWPWVVMALAGALLAASVWLFTAGPLTPTPIPTLAGKPTAEAIAALGAVHLSHRDEEVFSETVPKGSVVDSQPTAGTTIWRFSPVTLRISKGPERYAVPPVTGIGLTDAESQITAAKLTVGDRSEAYDETVATGAVLSVNPTPGTLLPPGGTVDLVVSKGRKPIDVDDWTGKPADQASAALSAAGLIVDATNRQVSETVAKGSVISQDPHSGTLFQGDKVTLVVSDGPPLVEVPDLFGKQVDKAKAILEAAGFKVQVEALLGGVFGTVRSQDPPAGTKVPKGSTVTIRVV